MTERSGLRVFVAIKRVIDFAVKTRVRSDGKWVETESVKHSMNPFDEIAVEEAIRLKEKKLVDHITVVSCGPAKCIDTIRTALAMGADAGIHIDTSEEHHHEIPGDLQPLSIAKLLCAIARRDKPDIFLLGKQAIDDDSNQTGQLLAGMLQWNQATFASEIKPISQGGNQWQITREVDGGLQVLKLSTPMIITTDLRLNEPRYASLQNIMKAKQKPITKETPKSLNLSPQDMSPRLQILSVAEPSKRSAGKKVDSVDMLVKLLKEEAQVIQ